MNELDRYAVSLENMEVLRAQVEAQARELERLRLNIAEYNEHERCYQSELAALTASAPNHSEQAREGWQLVPVEPTQAMFEAGRTSASGSYAEKLAMASYWRNMLAAAPSAGSQGGDV